MKPIFVPLLRFQSFLYKNKLIIFAKIINNIIRIIYSAEISYVFNPPQKIKFAHSGLGVTIHSHAKIYENCKIGVHVIIGNTKNAKHPPIIKENCIINARATILGETILSKNCTVGAGSILFNKKVPPNSTILGPFGQTREEYIQYCKKNI